MSDDKEAVIKVIPDEDLHAVPIVVCMRKADVTMTEYPDNLESPCEQCGETVIYRPDVPPEIMRVCMPCAIRTLGPDLFKNVVTTPNQLKQLEEKGIIL